MFASMTFKFHFFFCILREMLLFKYYFFSHFFLRNFNLYFILKFSKFLSKKDKKVKLFYLFVVILKEFIEEMIIYYNLVLRDILEKFLTKKKSNLNCKNLTKWISNWESARERVREIDGIFMKEFSTILIV